MSSLPRCLRKLATELCLEFTKLPGSFSLSFLLLVAYPHVTNVADHRRPLSWATCHLHLLHATVICRGEFAVFPSFFPCFSRVKPRSLGSISRSSASSFAVGNGSHHASHYSGRFLSLLLDLIPTVQLRSNGPDQPIPLWLEILHKSPSSLLILNPQSTPDSKSQFWFISIRIKSIYLHICHWFCFGHKNIILTPIWSVQVALDS